MLSKVFTSSEEDLLCLCVLGLHASAQKWLEATGGPRAYLEGNYSPELIADARAQLGQLKFFVDSGGQVLFSSGDPGMGRISRAPKPPLAAFFRGDVASLSRTPSLAIVGSRQATPRGLARAYDIARACAENGIAVISGGALGIDMAAHEGALRGGGETVCVLGDTINAKQDERPRRLLKFGAKSGFHSITTYGPWIPQSKNLFASRNQYVAALSDAVLLVEGTSTSGALHTARYAESLQIPVWAIPGDPDSILSQAPNQLISKHGAHILLDPQELITSLLPEKDNPSKTRKKRRLNSELHPVLKVIQEHGGEIEFDLLLRSDCVKASEFQVSLFELELDGKVARQGSKYVVMRI